MDDLISRKMVLNYIREQHDSLVIEQNKYSDVSLDELSGMKKINEAFNDFIMTVPAVYDTGKKFSSKDKLQDMADAVRKLAIFASIAKTPDEFFKHMQGHTTELSIVLNAFEIAENSELIAGAIEKQINDGWIPISEGLPLVNAYHNIYVTLKHKESEAVFSTKMIWKNGILFWFNGRQLSESYELIAWQKEYMPKPYSPEKQGK